MIMVGDAWGIEVNSREYTVLKKAHNKKTNEDVWGPVTYHTTMQDAVKSIAKRIDRLSLADKDMTLSEAIKTIEDNHMKLKVIIEGAFPDIEVKLK